MRLPKLVIFDMDGLLYDTERLFMNKRAEILKKYGYTHKDEDYIRTLGAAGKNLKQILADIYGPDYPADTITKEAREAELAHLRTCGPEFKPGILKLLDYLALYQIPACVATSTTSEYASEFLRLGDILDRFLFVISGDEVTHSKPNPEIFLSCCRRANTAPEDALVLEDSENGVRAAYAGHIPVFCIPDLKQPSQEIRDMASGVFADANEVCLTLGFHESS